MMDLAFLGLTAVLIGLTWGFIAVCEKLMDNAG
jgi:hypothetical protein